MPALTAESASKPRTWFLSLSHPCLHTEPVRIKATLYLNRHATLQINVLECCTKIIPNWKPQGATQMKVSTRM